MSSKVEIEFRSKGTVMLVVEPEGKPAFTVKARGGIALVTPEQATILEKHYLYGREFQKKRSLPVLVKRESEADRLRQAADKALENEGITVASKIREMAEKAKSEEDKARLSEPVKQKNPNRVASMQKARAIREQKRAERAAATLQQEGVQT